MWASTNKSSCIVNVPSLVEFAEIQGLGHTMGWVNANNTGFSLRKEIKASNEHFLGTVSAS